MSDIIFKDKAIIITGASSGIGRELALLCADQEALLVLASRNTEELELVATECRNRGGKALVVQTDVAYEDQCKNLIDRTVSEYGQIDMLVNNAGYGSSGHLDELPDLERFKNVLDVNFRGSVYCTYYALPYLKKSQGRIVGISSVLGKVAAWGGTAYCSSKFAMAGFFDALRIELRPTGVSVTLIYPGYIATHFAGNVVKTDGTKMGAKGMRLYTKRVMTAHKAAEKILNAATKRKREKVLTALGKFAVVLNKFFPKLIDRMSDKIQDTRKKRMEDS